MLDAPEGVYFGLLKDGGVMNGVSGIDRIPGRHRESREHRSVS